MTASVRPYQAADLDACRALWAELTQHHRDIYSDQTIGGDDPGRAFDAHLEHPQLAGVWVAEDETGVAGLCGLLVYGEEAEVEPVVVRAAQRSRGTGRALVAHAIAEARTRGVRFLGVRPVARNERALSFFHDAGFRMLGHVDLFMELSHPTEREWRPGITIRGKELRY